MQPRASKPNSGCSKPNDGVRATRALLSSGPNESIERLAKESEAARQEKKEKKTPSSASSASQRIKRVRVTDAFPGGVGRFPINPVISAGFEAIFKGGRRARSLSGGWFQDDGGGVAYIHLSNRSGHILVYPNPPREPDAVLPTAETRWGYVESFNPLTADVALAVLAQLCEPSQGDRPKYPMLQPVLITARAILDYKGIKRRGPERQVLVKRIDEEMERLRALHFDVEAFPAFDAAANRYLKASWQGDRLFDIVKVELRQGNVPGGQQQIAVGWKVRAGQWAYWWLNAQGRVYLGRIARALLQLDHRSNRGAEVMAKKIGTRLLLISYASEPLRFGIGRLLEFIGELPEPTERGKNWAAHVRGNFERALMMLGPGDAITPGIGLLSNVEWPGGSDRMTATGQEVGSKGGWPVLSSSLLTGKECPANSWQRPNQQSSLWDIASVICGSAGIHNGVKQSWRGSSVFLRTTFLKSSEVNVDRRKTWPRR
jgi:hypothetical protein